MRMLAIFFFNVSPIKNMGGSECSLASYTITHLQLQCKLDCSRCSSKGHKLYVHVSNRPTHNSIYTPCMHKSRYSCESAHSAPR